MLGLRVKLPELLDTSASDPSSDGSDSDSNTGAADVTGAETILLEGHG